MKKILAMILCALMVSTCLIFASCDLGDEDIANAPETETETETETESTNDGKKTELTTDSFDALTGGTEIEKLGGKSAKEVYKAAYQTVQNMTQYAFSLKQVRQSEGAEPSTMTLECEVSATSAHINQKLSENYSQEGWHVDGTSYVKTYLKTADTETTTKEKETQTVDEFLGNVSSLLKSMVMNLDDSTLDEAKLMKVSDSLYYVEISLTKDEAIAANMGDSAFTYKAVFDGNGDIIGVFLKTETTEITIVLKATADVAAVTAPADASEYKETEQSGASSKDPSNGGNNGDEATPAKPN